MGSPNPRNFALRHLGLFLCPKRQAGLLSFRYLLELSTVEIRANGETRNGSSYVKSLVSFSELSIPMDLPVLPSKATSKLTTIMPAP